MLEYIIVGLIVLAAVAVLFYKLFKTSAGSNVSEKCACCSNCNCSNKI